MIPKRSVVLVFVFSFLLASPCIAKQGGAGGNAGVKALVELHNKSLSAHDLKGVMETYAPDPDIVLMGTGPGECYVGEEAVGSAYNQVFKKFDPNSLRFKYDWKTVGSKGNFAWFSVTTTIEGSQKDERKERAFNMSGTMKKEKGKWRFVSMHFSRLGAEGEQSQ